MGTKWGKIREPGSYCGGKKKRTTRGKHGRKLIGGTRRHYELRGGLIAEGKRWRGKKKKKKKKKITYCEENNIRVQDKELNNPGENFQEKIHIECNKKTLQNPRDFAW